MSGPKESHLAVIKCIIRYLIGTSSHGLWYPKLDEIVLKGFSDINYAGDKVDRKKTSGTCQFMEKYLSHGIARSKIVFPYPLLNLNIFLLGYTILFFGSLID